MFESCEALVWESSIPDSGSAHLPASGTAEGLRGLLRRIGTLDGSGASEAELIDQIRAMEELKAGLAAAQARVTCTLSVERKRAEAARGVRASDRGRGLGSEIALARHVSPTQGARHLGFAAAMTEMPHTMRALSRGQISEWSATVLVKETAILSREHRTAVDVELADRLGELGPRDCCLSPTGLRARSLSTWPPTQPRRRGTSARAARSWPTH